MEYEAQTFFGEEEYDCVTGFTILEAQNGRYHIAEKWHADKDEESSATGDRWISYWIPEADLLGRIEKGHCEKKGTLTDEQFRAVCDNLGHSTEELMA